MDQNHTTDADSRLQRFATAEEQMSPQQTQQAIALGEACGRLLGSQELGLAFQSVQAQLFNDIRHSKPHEPKTREFAYAKGQALDEIQSWLVEQAQFANYLQQGQADTQDPELQEQDRLNRQGFGLDEDYRPVGQ